MERFPLHYVATGITPAMGRSTAGQGSGYALACTDYEGNYLDGANTYNVTMPAPIPAESAHAARRVDQAHVSDDGE